MSHNAKNEIMFRFRFMTKLLTAIREKGLDAELLIEGTQLLHILQECHVGVINALWLRS